MGRRGSGLAGQHLEQVGFGSPFGGGGHIPFVAQGFQRFPFGAIGGEGEGSGEEDRASVAHSEILTLSRRQSKPDQTFRGLKIEGDAFVINELRFCLAVVEGLESKPDQIMDWLGPDR